MARSSIRTRTLRLLEKIWRPQTDPGSRVVVLLYHVIHPEYAFASATPIQFADHLTWLRENCDVVPLRDIPTRAKQPAIRPAVAITFDDGFSTDFEYALPELIRYQLPATFFVTTGLVDRKPAVIERFARLLSADSGQITGMSWDQVGALQAAGMEIGAHTVTHPNLAVLDGASATAELRESKEQLEDHLGEPVTSFAYPFGKPKHNVTRDTVDLTRRAGFDVAVTVNFRGVRSTDRPLRIPRFAVVGDDVETLQAKVEGQMDLLGLWQEKAPRWLSHAVSPVHSHRSEGSLVE